MITTSDAFHTYDVGTYYTIVPQQPVWKIEDYISHFNAKKVPEGFSYSSGDNDQWETLETLRAKIKEHVDPNFSVE